MRSIGENIIYIKSCIDIVINELIDKNLENTCRC